MRFVIRTILVLSLVAGLPATAAAQDYSEPKRDRQMQQLAQNARRATPERHGPRAIPWSELSEADQKAVTEFVEENFPRMGVELEWLKETAPIRYERRMSRVAQEARRLMAVKEKDPRRGEAMIREKQVGFQLQQLAREYRSAGDDQTRARIRATIREHAAREFDDRLERRQADVRELESKLEALKARLGEMESVRDDLIEKRARELVERKKKDEASDEPRQGGKRD